MPDFRKNSQGTKGEGTLAMSGKTHLVRALSWYPAALLKQMYWIFALYCCFIAQSLK
jgi:hypothetical protein